MVRCEARRPVRAAQAAVLAVRSGMRWCGLILNADEVALPSITDGLERGSPPQCLEVLGEVVGSDEGQQMLLKATERLRGKSNTLGSGFRHDVCLSALPDRVEKSARHTIPLLRSLPPHEG